MKTWGYKVKQDAFKKMQIRELTLSDIHDCKKILYGLPKWFGMEESNRAYIESLRTLPGAVALVNGRIIGFIALFEHTPESYEIHVMAVDETFHRQGTGRALIQWAESWCREKDIPWLHVKTRGPLTPDPYYERTRLFYLGRGFQPLFESLTLWGPENSALVMVKKIGG
jgi:GNAT superfamily N-acetyltransferase